MGPNTNVLLKMLQKFWENYIYIASLEVISEFADKSQSLYPFLLNFIWER